MLAGIRRRRQTGVETHLAPPDRPPDEVESGQANVAAAWLLAFAPLASPCPSALLSPAQS